MRITSIKNLILQKCVLLCILIIRTLVCSCSAESVCHLMDSLAWSCGPSGQYIWRLDLQVPTSNSPGSQHYLRPNCPQRHQQHFSLHSFLDATRKHASLLSLSFCTKLRYDISKLGYYVIFKVHMYRNF